MRLATGLVMWFMFLCMLFCGICVFDHRASLVCSLGVAGSRDHRPLVVVGLPIGSTVVFAPSRVSSVIAPLIGGLDENGWPAVPDRPELPARWCS